MVVLYNFGTGAPQAHRFANYFKLFQPSQKALIKIEVG